MKVDLTQLNGMDICQKADFIQGFYENVLFSPSGIAYCMQKIDGDEIRPLCDKDFEGCMAPDFSKWGPRAPESAAAYYTNENSISTSGLYLASQCYRFMVTGSEEALKETYKAFNSLWLIYKMNADEGQPGFMSKPYGFKISEQTSGDQYLHASWGLFEFYPMADAETQDKIKEMTVAFADYWRKVDYVLSYIETHWDMKNDVYDYNAILVMLNMVAWYYTKDQQYLDEANKLFKHAKWHYETVIDEVTNRYSKLLDDIKDGKETSKGHINDLFAEYLGDEEFLLWEMNIHCQFATVAADIICRIKPDFIAQYMPDLTVKWLDIWKLGVEDYAGYYWYALNARTGKWRSIPITPLLPVEKWPYADKFMGYLSQIRWGEPIARAMQTAEITYIYSEKKEETRELAVNMLNAVDGTRLRWMFDFDGKQLLPDLRHTYNILSSESPATWLATYWRGRYIGIV